MANPIFRGFQFSGTSTLDVHQRVVKTCKNYWEKNNQPPNVVLVGGSLASKCHAAYKIKYPDGTSAIATIETHPIASELTMLAGIRE